MRTAGTPTDGSLTPIVRNPERWAGPPATAAGASSTQGSNVDIRRLVAPMLRHRWALLAATVVFGGAAVAFVRWELPQYRATATIRLDDPRRDVTVGIEAPEKASGPMTNPVVSEIQLLRSRDLVGRVVDSLGLRLRPDFRHLNASLLKDVRVADSVAPDTLQMRFDAETMYVVGTHARGRAAYGQPIALGGLTFTMTARPEQRTANWIVRSREGAIDALLEKLVVYPRVFSDVVDVSYTGYRPTITRRVVNGIVRGFVDAGIESATAAARKRREFLESQMLQNDSLLQNAEAELIEFRRRQKLFSTPARIDAQQREVLDLEQRWSELAGTRRTYQTLLDQVSALRRGKQRGDALRAVASSPELAANPAIATLVQQLLAHERVLDSLRTGPWRSAESDPDVQRTQSLVLDTQDNLLGLLRGYISSIDARSAALDRMRTRATSNLVELPSIDAEDARLGRRVSTLANLGEYMRGEYQKARIAEGAAIGRAVVLDTAFTPYKPVAQFRSVKIVLGALVGLLLGMLVAAIVENRNTSIRGREDLEASGHLPVLGVVPRLEAAPVTRGGTPARASVPRLTGAPDHGDTAGAGAPPFQAANVLDAYRILRTNVTRAGGGGAPGSIVVTSAAPGDGKTTIAANLALAFAREGRRVLLVDCDLRRAAVHRLFKVRKSPGLAQVLDGRASLEECIQPSSVDGLFLLPAGDADVESGRLLERTTFRRTVDQLTNAFDMLIIDSAPVLAVADAAMMSPIVDGVLVVVRAGVTDRDDVVEAMRQLDTAGAVVLGGVINDPTGHMAERAHSYYQAYATN